MTITKSVSCSVCDTRRFQTLLFGRADVQVAMSDLLIKECGEPHKLLANSADGESLSAFCFPCGLFINDAAMLEVYPVFIRMFNYAHQEHHKKGHQNELWHVVCVEKDNILTMMCLCNTK